MIKPNGFKRYHMLFIETGIQKVLEVFYKYPDKEFSLSDLAREAKVAKSNLSKIVDEFCKIGFIGIKKLTKIWRIRANRENWRFTKGKIIYNLNLIYQSGFVEFINDYYNNPKAIILFGSYRKGEDLSNSDIDVAVENDDFKDYKIVELKELKEFEKLIGRKIHIHEFNRKLIDINLFNNIANGIILTGFLEVKA